MKENHCDNDVQTNGSHIYDMPRREQNLTDDPTVSVIHDLCPSLREHCYMSLE